MISVKKLNDKNLVKKTRNQCPTLIAHNNGGFDLYFLLKMILELDDYSSLFTIKNIFKGS